jgi:hypothetical protein
MLIAVHVDDDADFKEGLQVFIEEWMSMSEPGVSDSEIIDACDEQANMRRVFLANETK